VVFAVSEGDVLGWLSPAVGAALLLAVSRQLPSLSSRAVSPIR
jgi:hypothetical protein